MTHLNIGSAKSTIACCMILTVCCSSSYAESQIADTSSLSKQLEHQQQQIDNLKLQINSLANAEMLHPALNIGGFFDVTAHTTDNSDHPFDLGGLELDLQFDPLKHIAVSTALVWDGDAAEVAVAVLDYHLYDHEVPARGNIFGETGLHVQFGRFDIPFGIDYNFFAAPDRTNITAPLTTERIQNDGFNGDGLRVYGSWSKLDYALYLTNSLFEDQGTSVGARIGYYPGRDPFRVHNKNQERDFVIGFSFLRDMDSQENVRNELSALDLSWRINIVELTFEGIKLDNKDEIFLPSGSSAGPADESGYNISLLLDFDPAAIFVGYGEWKPDYSAVLDSDDPATSYEVSRLKRLTFGTRYIFDDYLQIKLEYLTHLATSTEEPDFENRRLTFQMVASF